MNKKTFNLKALTNNELRSINGGDNFLRDLGWVLGKGCRAVSDFVGSAIRGSSFNCEMVYGHMGGGRL